MENLKEHDFGDFCKLESIVETGLVIIDCDVVNWIPVAENEEH